MQPISDYETTAKVTKINPADFKVNTIAISKGVKYDQGKARYDLVPSLAEAEIAKVFTYGANKYNEAYDEENWRKLDHRKRRLYSATRRHIQAVEQGETHDDESGLHHYAHACSNLMMLLQLDLEQKTQKGANNA